MSSPTTKRCFASAGVRSTGSDTETVDSGGRALDALLTGVLVAYWPACPPAQPMKLVTVVPVHVTGPDAPNWIVFAVELKFEVLSTLMVNVPLGGMLPVPLSDVGPVSVYEVADPTFLSSRTLLPSRPYTLYETAAG